MTRRISILAVLLCLVTATLALLGPKLPSIQTLGSPLTHDSEPPLAFGWVDDPLAVRAASADLPFARFCHTDAFAARHDGPDDVFLWDACRTVTGDLLPPRNQKGVGACVGFGTAAAVEHLMCVQIANGSDEEFRELAPEMIYAGSRVEIGGGRVRGDGSIGAWAARFVNEYGVVPRDVYGSHDLREYDEERCREFGRTGVPDELEPLAREHPVQSVANVRTWDECRAAVRNGYPLIVCSSQGFTMTRDADGFCSPRGRWYHCLAVVGVRGGKRPGAFLLNCWGPNTHTGPRGPGDPSPAGFWAEAWVVDRMLRQGDSWAFSDVVGFPPRRLAWRRMAA
jgi:hypothetical protein